MVDTEDAIHSIDDSSSEGGRLLKRFVDEENSSFWKTMLDYFFLQYVETSFLRVILIQESCLSTLQHFKNNVLMLRRY